MKALMLSTSGLIKSVKDLVLFNQFLILTIVISQNQLNNLLTDTPHIPSNGGVDVIDMIKQDRTEGVFKVLVSCHELGDVRVSFYISDTTYLQLTDKKLVINPKLSISLGVIGSLNIDSNEYPMSWISLNHEDLTHNAYHLTTVKI